MEEHIIHNDEIFNSIVLKVWSWTITIVTRDIVSWNESFRHTQQLMNMKESKGR